ncbi:MAG TPA: hypothetical protein VM490_08885 [Armatimonadaceae bacterium]|nr:hypothetical protein [Armatimonadaceae bacterium]
MPTGESGAFKPYTPPAPDASAAARSKSRSPLRMVGFGCALLTAVVLIAVIVAGVRCVGEMNRPIDQAAELKSLKDVPAYTGAAFDEQVTRLGRGTLAGMRAFVPAKDYAVVGFRTRATADAILSFYDRKMLALGYKPVALGSSDEPQNTYAKGRTMVVVQAKEHPETEEPNTRMVLILRFDGTTRRLDGKDMGGGGM